MSTLLPWLLRVTVCSFLFSLSQFLFVWVSLFILFCGAVMSVSIWFVECFVALSLLTSLPNYWETRTNFTLYQCSQPQLHWLQLPKEEYIWLEWLYPKRTGLILVKYILSGCKCFTQWASSSAIAYWLLTYWEWMPLFPHSTNWCIFVWLQQEETWATLPELVVLLQPHRWGDTQTAKQTTVL